MTFEIPQDINERSGLGAATYFRDLGLGVVPFEPSKKRPSLKGWQQLTSAVCDDAFLGRWWGNGHARDLGVLVDEPLVIVDLDGPGDPQVVITWLHSQPQLAAAPYETTSRGVHVWLNCPDMPANIRAEERIVSTLVGGIGAELFVRSRAVRTTPSGLESGGRYRFAQTGLVPEISWSQLRKLFGIAEEIKGKAGRPKKERPWWADFSGDLSTIDHVKMLAESKHLVGGDLLDAETNKHAIECPWRDDHSTPALGDAAPDSSTVIFKPPGMWPVFKCLHAHCSERGLADLCRWVEAREPGLVDACCTEKRPLWGGKGSTAPDGLPRIVLPTAGRSVSEFAAEAGAVIGPKREWYVRTEEVCRVAEIHVGSRIAMVFRKVDTPYARTGLEAFAETGIVTRDRETDDMIFEKMTPSADVTSATLASPAFLSCLPEIRRVLDVPIPLPLAEGTFALPCEGYDERFQTFLRPGMRPPRMMSVTDAITWLHRVHAGFALADDQSGVHALARLITPYVRGIMGFDHRPPVWHYHANRPRAGKDYLAALAPLIFEGNFTEDAPLGKHPEETGKRMVAALRSGRRTMHFANCQGHLDDEYFIGSVTASMVGSRNMGRNGAEDDLQLPNEIEFSLSANSGLTFRTDMEPRTRRISLFFGEEDANNRTFPIPDLHGWVITYRGELLSAVATLVHTWLAAGAPKGSTPFSSFKRWGEVVGGIMEFHGLGDPCMPHVDDDGCPADQETSAMIALFETMYTRSPDKWVTKPEIYDVIKDGNGEIDAFETFGDLVGDRSKQTEFGQMLRRYVGRELAGITLLDDGARRKARAKYKFTKAAGKRRGGGFSGASEQIELNLVKGDQPCSKSASTEPEHGGKVVTLATLVTSGLPTRREINYSEHNLEYRGLINTGGAAAPEGYQGCQGYQPPADNPSAAAPLLVRRSDLAVVAADLKDAPSIALDLETYGAKKGDGLDPRRGDIRLLTACREGGPIHVLDLRAIGYDLGPLRDVLVGGAEIIAHNAKFDLGWLAEKCGIRPPRVFCTCTASRLLAAGTKLRHGLDVVLERHLGLPPGPDLSTSDWGDLILTPDQLHYASADVAHLHRLADVLRSDLVEAGLDDVVDLEMRLLGVVVGMESAGVGIDRALLRRIKADATVEAGKHEAEVRAVLGMPDLNLRSPAQLLDALRSGGLDIDDTAEGTLKRVAGESAAASAILRHRSADKAAQQPESLIKAAGMDNRIRCSFNQCGTDTGRFSSSRPNLQNIGRGAIRSAFVPAPGHNLIVGDYSQIELRIAAVVAQDDRMLSAYRDGADLHRETAAAVLEKSLADVTKADRQLAKAVNFGLLYGQGAPGLVRYAAASYGVTIAEEDAARIRALFFAQYKGLSRWHAKGWGLARGDVAEVRTRMGRRRLIPEGADEWERFTTLVNTEVQGGAADGMKRALVQIADQLPAGSRIISTVHDEVIVEAPDFEADAVCELTREIMIKAMADLYPEVPIEVEARVCSNWGDKA
ncbi:MAG: DNA polymerase [Verrucomicrobiales bacterium]